MHTRNRRGQQGIVHLDRREDGRVHVEPGEVDGFVGKVALQRQHLDNREHARQRQRARTVDMLAAETAISLHAGR